MLFSNIIKKRFDAVLGRYDGDPAMHYDTVYEHPGLSFHSFDVPGDNDIMLKGCFYYRGDFRPDKLIIFDHGIGAGHLAYLKEIDYMAEKGYTVYSYDHTGCVATSGSGIKGFAQGINDLDHVLKAFNEDETLKEAPRKLVGHSWGAYSCMNAAALHPEVTHIVSLAGFLSARSLIEQYLPKAFLRYSEEVMDRERLNNPEYADMDASDSLKISKAGLLYLQSEDDIKVRFDLGYIPLEKALAGRENTEFIRTDHRGHDPQRTDRAAAANNAMLEDLERERKKKHLDTASEQEAFRNKYDWDIIGEQDPEMWERIIAFLEDRL